jgi:hypothetical protein
VYHPLELELLENEFCSLYLMLQVKNKQEFMHKFCLGASGKECKNKQEIMITFFKVTSREEGKCKQEIIHQGPDDGGSTYL